MCVRVRTPADRRHPGPADDYFDYNGVPVHPHVFRHALGARPQIVEYQVRQQARGATITVRCSAPVDCAGMAAEVEGALRGVGVAAPAVRIEVVDRIERGTMGKLKRFVPLGGAR